MSSNGAVGSPPGKFVDLDGQRIHYEQVGTGEHVLLLIPGAIGSTRSDFTPQLDPETGFDQDEFTIVSVDLPGYGYSRPPERDHGPMIYFYDAVVCARLMEHLGHRIYSVLGWSDGAKVALVVAYQNPGRVAKLIVWGVLSYGSDHAVVAVGRTRDLSLWNEDMRANYERVYGKEVFHMLWDRHLKFCDNYFITGGRWDVREELPKIKCPTFILHGDRDPLIELAQAKTVESMIPDTRLHRYPLGSHNIHQAFTKDFNERVTDFLLSD